MTSSVPSIHPILLSIMYNRTIRSEGKWLESGAESQDRRVAPNLCLDSTAERTADLFVPVYLDLFRILSPQI